jgi:hypothetical protein
VKEGRKRGQLEADIRRVREGKSRCGGNIEVDSSRIMPMEKGLSRKTMFSFWGENYRIVEYRKRTASFSYEENYYYVRRGLGT